MTLAELIDEKEEVSLPIYTTGINFLDTPLGGGLQQGQIVTITGDTESGKTQLLNQMIAHLAKNTKCLYISLEFNKSQLKKHFRQKLQHKTVSQIALRNTIVITNEMIEGEISILSETIIRHIYEDGVTHIGIDSALMLYHNCYTGEQEVTEIFRQLHQLALAYNVTIFIIAQGTKQDNKDNRVSIFGSQKASHFPLVMLHLIYDRIQNQRKLIIAKNKQTGTYAEVNITLDKRQLLFKETQHQFQDTPISTEDESANNTLDVQGVEKKQSLWEIL